MTDNYNETLLVPFKLMECKKLTPTEKHIISYILGCNHARTLCTDSDEQISKQLGMSVSKYKRHKTKLLKLPFFNSTHIDHKILIEWINEK